MKFNDHSKLEGLHAPFGASQSSWLRYDEDRLLEVYSNLRAKEIGTKLHDWARVTIELGIRQARSRKTLCAYVNDAIGFGMKPEVVLYYSPFFFGTADSINFDEERNILRIHDLKTGKGKVHREQLEVYAALFCLEYKKNPNDLKMILRIYQNDDVDEWEPDPTLIQDIMEHIKHCNKTLIEEA